MEVRGWRLEVWRLEAEVGGEIWEMKGGKDFGCHPEQSKDFKDSSLRLRVTYGSRSTQNDIWEFPTQNRCGRWEVNRKIYLNLVPSPGLLQLYTSAMRRTIILAIERPSP